MQKPAVDLNKALEMVDGDKEFLKELVELFKKDCSEKLEEISSAIQKKDFKTIDEVAHSLKGASGNLGLMRIYELSFEIEKMGKETKSEGIEEIYEQLKEEFNNFKEFISQPGWEKG
ncbi:MAG: Hpt domain-containing protein [Deltaproteobacteria bacterium]|nr:Hpt domain-containing protein [Deltaproteobacteria bacterium]